MAYVKDDGIYRCRLQLDGNNPCIDVIEHYMWDTVNKCLDETKSRGGLQVILRADAYKVLENGELSTTCEELNLDNFGVTIITPAEQGEEVKTEVVSNFVRIFGLRDASELLTISSVDSEQLANAVFDVKVTNSVSAKTGKSYRNYWFAPVGETEHQSRAFVAPARNKATLDKYRAKLRVECKGIVGTTPEKAVSKPSMPTAKPAVSKTIPPRQQAEKGLDLNRVWEMWIVAYPEDIQGADFYEKIGAMFPNREASSLNSIELSAFCKANIPSMIVDDDDELPPF